MKNNYKPLIAAGFLVVAGLIAKTSPLAKQGVVGFSRVYSAYNQPASSALSSLARTQVLIGVAEGAEVTNAPTSAGVTAAVYDDPSSLALDRTGDALRDPGQPIGSAIAPLAAIQYTAKKGSTPSKSSLPNFNADFIMPAQGYNKAVLQADNSVEIENSCGTPVVAAADGVVVPDQNIMNAGEGWNDGYGTFVLIEHSFGNAIYTRYAHLQDTMVGVGDYVKQGQKIGLIGQTGNASECSLSFEVIGAKNPFGK